MKNIRINVGGEVFDVYYDKNNKAVAVNRKDKKEFEAGNIYQLIELIKKSSE